MTSTLTKKRRRTKRTWLEGSNTFVRRDGRAAPARAYSWLRVTDDEEMSSVTRAVIWVLILAVTPWIVFHLITYFIPDLLWIPITPQ